MLPPDDGPVPGADPDRAETSGPLPTAAALDQLEAELDRVDAVLAQLDQDG